MSDAITRSKEEEFCLYIMIFPGEQPSSARVLLRLSLLSLPLMEMLCYALFSIKKTVSKIEIVKFVMAEFLARQLLLIYDYNFPS